ncbi:unnamed protein product [Phytophthora lilii]|uniref:Unnamed protein product n=1 Tax=Phytophthora lilii TaxID=2077276 RepID=A0A9W7CM19_9STRA|nr:unnamed protein product [Phytophthora lilii]
MKASFGHIGVAQDNIKFDGSIRLYSSVYYDQRLLTVNFSTPNRCYNINCANLDNKIASAKWWGLPITGLAGKAYITFYTDTNCHGHQASTTLPHSGGIREFILPSVKGNITSFMVRSESRIQRHGSANVCTWIGVNVTGGSVSEDENGRADKLNNQ